jgi:superfamily II DNA or RNA helicase
MTYELRKYQWLNKEQIRQQFRRVRNVLYQAGTGSGKTVTAASIVTDAANKQTTTWFIAHRRELIEQASRTLNACGVHHGIIMAGYKYSPSATVQVCSIDTLRERLLKNDRLLVVHEPKLIIVDEAHRSLSPSYLNLFKRFPLAFRLGLSATPVRSDGRGLGHVYDSMVQAPSVAELIEEGWLVKPRYFTGATADLEGIKTHDYDYARGELQARMNNAVLRGDVVEQWLRHGNNRKTIVFASGVKHSLALKNEFEKAGIPAMHIDGHTLNSERMEMIEHFRKDDTYKVLCNCMIVTEGFDVPEVGCVVLATATKIISKYLQMGGRCLRPEEGKKDCIIIDHGSNIKRHGFLEDPVPWSMDKDGRITDRIPRERENLPREFECRECGAVFSGRVRCPECGTRLELNGQNDLINTVEELIEVTRGAAGMKAADKQKVYSEVERRNFHAQLLGYAEEKGHKAGWVAHKYRSKFGVWPPREWLSNPIQEPSKLVRAFIRGQTAAYHIRRKYREEHPET